VGRTIPVVAYKEGKRIVIGEAVVEDNGYGSFTVHVGRVSDIVSVEAMSFRVTPGKGNVNG
jgi:hypothetical protein